MRALLLLGLAASCHAKTGTTADATVQSDAAADASIDAPVALQPRGLFVPILSLDAHGISNAMAALALPDIDGIAIDFAWTDIAAAAPETYDYSKLDAMLQLAKGAGKAAELSVIAAGGTPAWFAPATVIELQYVPHDGAVGHCVDTFTPPLWDANYLAAWDDMTAQLAAHLAAAGFAETVVGFRLTGLNASTAESHLAEESPASETNPPACFTVDNVAAWQAAGYTPSKIQAAWAAIVTSWATHFPTALFEFITWEGAEPRFPPIDDTGTIVAPSTSADKAQYDMAVATAAAQLGSRLVIGRFFLMTDTPAEPSVVAYANTYGIGTIWQTNLWWSTFENGSNGTIPGAAGCGGMLSAPTQCTDALYLDELDEGVTPTGLTVPLPTGATRIIEVYLPDPTLYPIAVHTVHVALTQ